MNITISGSQSTPYNSNSVVEDRHEIAPDEAELSFCSSYLSNCPESIQQAAQVIMAIFIIIISIPGIPLFGFYALVNIVFNKISNIFKQYLSLFYSFPEYNGFKVKADHFSEAKFTEPPQADPTIQINRGLNRLLADLEKHLKDEGTTLDLSKMNQGNEVSYDTFILKFKTVTTLYKSDPSDIPENAMDGQRPDETEEHTSSYLKIQNYLRHIIATFQTQKSAWEGLPDTDLQKINLKTAYYKNLNKILPRICALFFHCSNDIGAGLEEIYLDFVANEVLPENKSLENRLQYALTQYRNTIFDQACSLENDDESAGTKAVCGYYFGESYGVTHSLSSEMMEYEYTANSDAFARIPQFFNEQYLIPTICTYLRERMAYQNEKILPPSIVKEWFEENFSIYKMNQKGEKEFIDTTILQALLTENGEWSDDALMLLLENKSIIELANKKIDNPLTQYWNEIAQKKAAYELSQSES